MLTGNMLTDVESGRKAPYTLKVFFRPYSAKNWTYNMPEKRLPCLPSVKARMLLHWGTALAGR